MQVLPFLRRRESRKVWVKLKPPGCGPQICDSPFWGTHVSGRVSLARRVGSIREARGTGNSGRDLMTLRSQNSGMTEMCFDVLKRGESRSRGCRL